MLDVVLFAVFPYLAVVLAVFVSIHRYRTDRFSYSSFSSQFVEKRALFWGSVPWHYAVIAILLAHLFALAFPESWGRLIAAPARLYVLEATGLALALVALLGLLLLIGRRVLSRRAFVMTSLLDWILLSVLLSEVFLGFSVAFVYRWGSDWYLHTAVPWLVSLAVLQPQVGYVTALPWPVKLHMLGGFLVIGLFPFTRLVHLVTFPVTYLWRPYQVVVWVRRARGAERGRVGSSPR